MVLFSHELFLFPDLSQTIDLCHFGCEFRLNTLKSLLGSTVALTFQSLALNLQSDDSTIETIDFLGLALLPVRNYAL